MENILNRSDPEETPRRPHSGELNIGECHRSPKIGPPKDGFMDEKKVIELVPVNQTQAELPPILVGPPPRACAAVARGGGQGLPEAARIFLQISTQALLRASPRRIASGLAGSFAH